MKVALASDHAGYKLKKRVITHLKTKGIETHDFGPFDDQSVDYPDYAHTLSDSIEKGEHEIGITFCGSGNGINIAANKHQGIRSALCWNPEIAMLARQHNNANILALPARFISENTALEIVNVFLATDFEGGRHLKRINKIPLK